MTRTEIVTELRRLSGNRYFLATDLDNPDGFHVHDIDLKRMDRAALKRLLARVHYDATDKGIWFIC
jgi:hypothetical protein